MEYPEVLKDLADNLAENLVRRGQAPEDAAAVAWEAAEFIRGHWGGQKIYIPKGDSYDLSRRDVEIFARWRGTNALELCREFGITHTRLFQIIHAVRRARRPADPDQPALFLEEAK